MGGHWHDSTAGSQNQGNHIGDRSCVRQSKLYRQYESGNAIKDLMGTSHMKWDVNRKQGAYAGQKVYDHKTADHSTSLRPRGGGAKQGARRNAGSQPTASSDEFPCVGGFYGAEYAVAGGRVGRGGSGNMLAHHAEPYRQDSLDVMVHELQRQEQSGAHLRKAPPFAEVQPPPQLYAPTPAHKKTRLEIEKQEQQAAKASEQHLFGNSTAASILKTRPW